MDDQGRRELARRRRSQAKRRRQRTIILKGIFTFIIIVGIIAALFLWRRYGPSKERADLGGMLSDGKAYVEYSLVRDYINERFYWDPNENTLLYTLPNDVVSVGVGNKEYSVSKAKNSVDYTILRTEGSTAYIALDFVKQYTDMDYEVYDNPGRVMICTETGTTTVAEVKRDTQVRYQGGVKSPVLTDVEKKEVVTVIETEGSWKKVRTEDGFIGYIKETEETMPVQILPRQSRFVQEHWEYS